jgi:uncharacterized protein
MKEQLVTFFSDGIRLDGALYRGENHDPSKPLLIINSGFTGLRNIHPARFARALTPLGYACFAFDYRGFAESEGERGRVLLEEQARDITNAVTFMSDRLENLGRGIVLAGWGMAGGLILEAARMCPPLRGLIAMNGFYDAERVQRALRSDRGYRELLSWLAARRRSAVVRRAEEDLDPFAIYPLDPKSRKYVDEVLRQTEHYDRGAAAVKLSFADSLLRFKPERDLDHLRETPILIAHGDENQLHPVEEANSLHAKYPGPKALHWIRGAGHTEWMLDEHPLFQQLVGRIDVWLKELPWAR